MRRNASFLLLLGMILVGGFAVAGEQAAAIDDGVVLPYLIQDSRVSPSYPPAALAARYEAVITLSANVLESGSVGEIEILGSTRPNLGFEEAAAGAVRQWRFQPAVKDGEAIGAYQVIRMHFRAPGSRSQPHAYVAAGFIPSRELGISALERPSVAARPDLFSPASFLGRQPLTPSKPPCQVEGCMYDRRSLFPSPPEHNIPNTPPVNITPR